MNATLISRITTSLKYSSHLSTPNALHTVSENQEITFWRKWEAFKSLTVLLFHPERQGFPLKHLALPRWNDLTISTASLQHNKR